MNNPFRYRPTSEMVAMAQEVSAAIAADPALDSLFHEGKMLGLLRHRGGWLLGYSGKRNPSATGVYVHGAFLQFVPPIFDVTAGYFKEKEAEISAMNRQISELSTLLESASQSVDQHPAPEAINQQSSSETINQHPTPETIVQQIEQLKLQRAMESVKLQRWTFEQYKLLNASGEERTVLEVYSDKNLIPPAATGDCAAPKLLQEAYKKGLEPLEIGEFWYGISPEGPVRGPGRFYPACSWKCGQILQFMLQGLDIEDSVNHVGDPKILFQDDSIVVVNKPSGMPAVPGLDGLESLEAWLHDHIEGDIYQVHRLDQDTSGTMVFARSRRSQGILQRQFENHTVEKTYLAVVDGRPAKDHGTIDLPLAPDFEDKPRQKFDPVQGKPAITDYRVLEGDEARAVFNLFGLSRSDLFNLSQAGTSNLCRTGSFGFTAVEFRPRTGRSHQIRVHAAHPSGLSAPILGDTLYGSAHRAPRLCLHAATLHFRHPVTGLPVTF